MNNQSFHLVDPSPRHIGGNFLMSLSLSFLVFMMFTWWRDVVREGTFEDQHTKPVEYGFLRMGMVLFIVVKKFITSFFAGLFCQAFFLNA